MSVQHVEGGICWCDDLDARVRALDVLWPDRCQVVSDWGSPFGERRTCTSPAGHAAPCRGNLEREGGPCHFCGANFDGESCPVCWTDLATVSLADQKALFADIDWGLTTPTEPTGGQE